VTPWVVVLSIASDPRLDLYRVFTLVGLCLFILQALVKALHHAEGLRAMAPGSEMAKETALQVLSQPAGGQLASVVAH